MLESKIFFLSLSSNLETKASINLRAEARERVQVHPPALLFAQTEANSAPGHLCVWVRVDWPALVTPPTHMSVRTAVPVEPASAHLLTALIQSERGWMEVRVTEQAKEKVKKSPGRSSVSLQFPLQRMYANANFSQTLFLITLQSII